MLTGESPKLESPGRGLLSHASPAVRRRSSAIRITRAVSSAKSSAVFASSRMRESRSLLSFSAIVHGGLFRMLNYG